MIPSSTKLTLMVLVLPVFTIVSTFIVGFYFYRESFDATAFSTAVSSLLSAVLVILLVWERLRDSLTKKLEYLHKNFLFKLFTDFRRTNPYWTQDEIKRLRADLERYGKFMNLSLYPKNILKGIDQFLSLHAEFYKRLKELEGLAEKQFGEKHLHSNLVYSSLGLFPDSDMSGYTDEIRKQYEEWAGKVIKDSKLVPEAQDLLEKIRRSEKGIFQKLEDFLKSNNLRLEEEPTANPYRY